MERWQCAGFSAKCFSPFVNMILIFTYLGKCDFYTHLAEEEIETSTD